MAARIRFACASCFRIHLSSRDRCIGHRGAARVRHPAGESAAGSALRQEQMWSKSALTMVNTHKRMKLYFHPRIVRIIGLHVSCGVLLRRGSGRYPAI